LGQISKNTIAYRIKQWIENYMANQDTIAGGYGVSSLVKTLKGVPAMIVGSGPTLDWNIKQLVDLQGRICIIACDSAMKALLDHGVKPDLVMTTDSKARVAEFLSGVDTSGLNFIVDTFAHPDTVAAIDGKIYWYNTHPVSDCPFTGALNQWTGYIGNLGTGGCVATTAWWFATRLLKADPDVLVGMPEAFYDPQQMYSSAVEKTIETDPYKQGKIKTHDIHGNECYTYAPLQSFAYWLEDAFMYTPGIHINCSEGGIIEHNVLNMPLEACADRYLQTKYDIEALLFAKERMADSLIASVDNDISEYRPMLTVLFDGPSLANLSQRMGKEQSEVHADIEKVRAAGINVEEGKTTAQNPDGPGEIDLLTFTIKPSQQSQGQMGAPVMVNGVIDPAVERNAYADEIIGCICFMRKEIGAPVDANIDVWVKCDEFIASVIATNAATIEARALVVDLYCPVDEKTFASQPKTKHVREWTINDHTFNIAMRPRVPAKSTELVEKAGASCCEPFSREDPPGVIRLVLFESLIDQWLREDARLPKKQRRTGKAIYELLKQRGYIGAASTVRKYIGKRRKDIQVVGRRLPTTTAPTIEGLR
jgi:hypothetical protein